MTIHKWSDLKAETLRRRIERRIAASDRLQHLHNCLLTYVELAVTQTDYKPGVAYFPVHVVAHMWMLQNEIDALSGIAVMGMRSFEIAVPDGFIEIRVVGEDV